MAKRRCFPPREAIQNICIIGDALREVRKAAGLLEEKLAEKTELRPNTIGEVERGEKTISVDALMRIADALKVPHHTLLSQTVMPPLAMHAHGVMQRGYMSR